jgi:hypothetical protein
MVSAKMNSTNDLDVAAVTSEPSVVVGARWLASGSLPGFRQKTVPAAAACRSAPHGAAGSEPCTLVDRAEM